MKVQQVFDAKNAISSIMVDEQSIFLGSLDNCVYKLTKDYKIQKKRNSRSITKMINAGEGKKKRINRKLFRKHNKCLR